MIRVNTFNSPSFLFPLNSSDIKSLTLNCFSAFSIGLLQRTCLTKQLQTAMVFRPNHSLCLSESLLDNSWSVSCSHHTRTGDYYNQDLRMLKWGGFLSSLPYKTLNLKRFSLAEYKSSRSKQQLPLLILQYLTGNTSRSYTQLLAHTDFQACRGNNFILTYTEIRYFPVSFLKCYTEFSFIPRNWKQSCIASKQKESTY